MNLTLRCSALFFAGSSQSHLLLFRFFLLNPRETSNLNTLCLFFVVGDWGCCRVFRLPFKPRLPPSWAGLRVALSPQQRCSTCFIVISAVYLIAGVSRSRGRSSMCAGVVVGCFRSSCLLVTSRLSFSFSAGYGWCRCLFPRHAARFDG